MHLSEGLVIRESGQYFSDYNLHAGAGDMAGCNWRSDIITFAFAYPATRKYANRIDIKITVTPVAKASRLASKRRIGSLPTAR